MTELASTHANTLDGTTSCADRESFEHYLAETRRRKSEADSSNLGSYLLDNPDLCKHRSLVIELAVEEYMQVEQEPTRGGIKLFCDQFSSLGQSLYDSIYRQLEVEKFLDEHPSIGLLHKEASWPKCGDDLGGFRILEYLGHGSLAHVYLCSEDALGDRQVVLKVSRSTAREGNTLGKLQHPNIVPVHSVDNLVDVGLECLCMPFLGRSTLHDLLSHGFSKGVPQHAGVIHEAATLWRLPDDTYSDWTTDSVSSPRTPYVESVLRLVEGLAEALEFAHSQGVIHGDIKPSNVLLTVAGHPLLLDFNLAHDDDQSIVVRGGTLPYMAPEQITLLLLDESTSPTGIDRRSDVYSLGVVLYELLCGELPFDVEMSESSGDMARELLDLQSRPPKSLETRNPHVSSGIATIVNRCLALRPEDRYSTMDELRLDLAKQLAPRKQWSRWASRNRLPLTWIILVFGLIGTSLAIWFASLPPSHVRDYEKGRSLYSLGEYERALVSFDQAIETEPEYVDASYARARANLALGNYDPARLEFARLATDESHVPSMAYLGYCFSVADSHSLAIPWYHKAIDEGLSTAAVFNNLAASYSVGKTVHSTSERLLIAKDFIESALQIAPHSATVRYNALKIELTLHESDSSYVVEGIRDHARTILEIGRVDKETSTLIARGYAFLAESKPAALDEGLEALISISDAQGTIELDFFYRDSALQSFLSHPLFDELKKIVSESNASEVQAIARFIEPAESD